MKAIDYNKHIWEGWTVVDFVSALAPMFDRNQFQTKQQVKKWCIDNQPYYKKHIKEVTEHFYNLINSNIQEESR